MKKRVPDKFWFPWWPDKWIFGSIRIECTLEERAIWVDLLSLASKDDGYIRANEETPYPIEQLAGTLMVPHKTLANAIEKFINLKDKQGKGKLTRTEFGTLYVTKWEKYQFSESYHRVQKHREKEAESRYGNGKSLQRNKKELPYYNKLNKSKLNKSKEENNKVPPPPSKKNINPKIEFDFDKRKFLNITIEDKAGWKDAYPAVDIDQELRIAREWLLANPSKRKSNYRQFINNWLRREQDKGGRQQYQKTASGHPMTRKEQSKKELDEWEKKPLKKKE